MSETFSSLTLRQKIGLLVGIALFVVVLLAPTPEGLPEEAKRAGAVALLMATWWISEAIPIPFTSLLPLVLFPALGVLPSEKVSPYYTDHTIFLFFGGFVVALAIQKWNLHRRIALHIIRFVGAQPSRLVLGFMTATAFLSMWMSNTACAMMMFPIAAAVVLQLASARGSPGNKPESDRLVSENFGRVLMLGIAYAASIGGIGTLIGTPPNIVFAGTSRRLFPDSPEIGFLQWMAIGVPVVVLYIPVAWFYLCRYSGQLPLRHIQFHGSETVIEEELSKMGKIAREEKLVLAVWSAMAILWIFRAPIRLGAFTVPGWSQLFGSHAAFLHDATVAMAMAILLSLIPAKSPSGNSKAGQGGALIDWETIRLGVPWGVLFLFGGGFALAAGIEQTGLGTWVGGVVGEIAGLPLLVMMALSCLVLMVVTEVTSNTAAAVMGMPILAAVALQMGVHPFLLMIPATISASCAFMLPVSTPPNAIVFSSGWVTIPQMARAGIVLDLLGIPVVVAIVYLLGPLVLDISLTQLPAWVK